MRDGRTESSYEASEKGGSVEGVPPSGKIAAQSGITAAVVRSAYLIRISMMTRHSSCIVLLNRTQELFPHRIIRDQYFHEIAP
jgi:hypothetical protein